MLCVEQLPNLIKDEIKFNVKACTIKTEWLKDKTVIALDSNFQVYDIYPYGFHNLEQIRRLKEINYLVIKNNTGMYLCDTRESHHLGAYRSRQTNIWDHFNDANKLSVDWWLDHLKYLGKRNNRYKTHLGSAENYLTDLVRWLERGEGSNNFTDDIKNTFLERIEVVNSSISKLKEAINEDGQDVSESTDTFA